jgi:hypothetical protein
MRQPAAFAALLASLILTVAVPRSHAAGPPTAAAQALAGHNAGYVLTLERIRGNDVAGVSGTMGYEVVDACDGWAVRQRLAMVITNADGQEVELVSDYTTYETKDGLRLRFRMKQTTDDAVTSQTEGAATLRRWGGPGEARYNVPRQERVELPAGTQFPMMHTASLLAAAKEGRKFLSFPLFDGTGDNGAEDSSAVILDWKHGVATDHTPLAKLDSTRVRLAFFERKNGGVTPSYEVGMRYWENGVADDMQMDFGDFVMRARMRDFTLLPKKC